MSLRCQVVLKGSASPEQLSTLGGALWGWCNRAAGESAIYQYVDNQLLADLIAGKFPVSSSQSGVADHRGLCFRVRGQASQDFRPTVDSLRRALPGQAVEDIVIDGVSWNLVD